MYAESEDHFFFRSLYYGDAESNSSIQLLPVTDKFEIDDKGKPYTQYTLFIRNSDWAEPFED